MHINVRVLPGWTFRRAALALSRAIDRKVPALASSKWWKEGRHGVFLDYNQNAKDRTTCSAYSVRPLPDARVSTPLHWDYSTLTARDLEAYELSKLTLTATQETGRLKIKCPVL